MPMPVSPPRPHADGGVKAFALPMVGYEGQVPKGRVPITHFRGRPLLMLMPVPHVDGGAEAFALPIMVGYVGQVPKVVFPSPSGEEALRGCVTLVGRMGAGRAGTRWWRAGLDTKVGGV